MALTKSTYTVPGKSQQFQDVLISADTLADGTLAQRFDRLAFPQKGVKFAGSHGAGGSVTVPKAARKTHGAGS